MEHSSKIQEIASRVKELREVSELSAEAVAGQLGISLETYLSYENAEADFPVSVLYELAALLRVDLTELLTACRRGWRIVLSSAGAKALR